MQSVSQISAFDRQMISRALQLAARGINTVTPNPAVGCVITQGKESQNEEPQGEKVVGEGWHRKAGGPHAEVHALAAAGDNAKGGTAYVSLEPCSHHGKTPPCAEALIAAGVKRVVYAMEDPNPAVSGRGLSLLRQAGIQTDGPVLEQQARQLNKGFIKRQQTGLPWVTVKLAMSVDGRTAMASGESQWITGAEARRDVQRLRAQSCAIVTGINTVLQDKAKLTVRGKDGVAGHAEEEPRQPLRVVLDSQGRLPMDAPLLQCGGSVLQVLSDADEPGGVSERLERVVLPGEQNAVPVALLKELAGRQCNNILVEAGATVAGSFLNAGLVDELVVYMAPTLLGSDARPLFDLPLDSMSQQVRLQIEDIRSVGTDIRMTFKPQTQV